MDAGDSVQVATEDGASTSEDSQQIFVRQLSDGSLVTADGQRLIFSKDDITEIQFSAEGDTIVMPSENGALQEDHTMEVAPNTLPEEAVLEDAVLEDSAMAKNDVQDPDVKETTTNASAVLDPPDDANNTTSIVEERDTSIEEVDAVEETVGETSASQHVKEVIAMEDGNESVVKKVNEGGDGRPRRSMRSLDAMGSRSVVEEIAAAFDDDTPTVATRRERSKKVDDSAAETDPDVLQISSPAIRSRTRQKNNQVTVESEKEPVIVSRGRGRPRKSEEPGLKSNAVAANKVVQKPVAESLAVESGSASPAMKRSALVSSQENKSYADTPKKQVRIMESPSISSMKSTPKTPASAIIPSDMKTPDQVYDFDDELTPSTSGKKVFETPEVAMNMSIETQTEEPEHIEVVYWDSSPGKRTVQTQTDPRLKMKKVKVEDSLFSGDESPKKRRRRLDIDDDFGLFEDSKRRLSKRTTEEALKCPFCDKSFIGLVKHIKSRHCDEPDFDEEMRNARWRERIMKVSSGTPETPGDACDDCGKVTMNMKRHRESHQMDRMQIPCPMCNKIVLKTGLSSHMRTVHSGRKPYKCPHCEYVSAFRGNLNTHVKGMHLHTRQYLCNVCHAAFKTLGALIGHTKRVHEGWKSPNQKIFICSVCEKRFTKKYHVDRHMLIHTGEKPHKCDDCQRTFNNKSNLMSHIQLVHKRLSPYQCDLCKETFKRKKLLLEHIGRVHVSRGEHIVFRTPMDEADQDDADESGEGGTMLQEVNQETLFADSNQVQLATVVSVEEAAHLTEGQHYTTLQTETGEETIIIVHSGDANDVAQVIMDQQDGGQQMYVETMQ